MRDELQALLAYLENAEARATAAGDRTVADDPQNSRYASEAGSLLATVDVAIGRVRAMMARCDG